MELIKENFNEVELDLFTLTINKVFLILERMTKNPDHDPKVDLKDENIAERYHLLFRVLNKEEIIEYAADRFGRGEKRCYFCVRKVLPMEIHLEGEVVGKVVYGSQQHSHSYAIAEFNELLKERLKKHSIDPRGWSGEGGGSIYCEVTEKEGQLEHTLRFSGSSNTYGPVEEEIFENWMRPALERYLEKAGLTYVKVLRGY